MSAASILLFDLIASVALNGKIDVFFLNSYDCYCYVMLFLTAAAVVVPCLSTLVSDHGEPPVLFIT